MSGDESGEILRRIPETLSYKNEAKESARENLGTVDDSEVACLRSNKVFMFFFRERGVLWRLMTESVEN